MASVARITEFLFSTPYPNISSKAPLPCGLNSHGEQKACEWPFYWTLIAAFASALVFSVVQVILLFVNDPGIKKKKVKLHK